MNSGFNHEKKKPHIFHEGHDLGGRASIIRSFLATKENLEAVLNLPPDSK